MASAGGSNEGNPMLQAQRALNLLQQDPQQLDQDRQRFEAAPPYYASRSPSPITLLEEQRLRSERRLQRIGERNLSLPRYQFKAQSGEEYNRLLHRSVPWNYAANTNLRTNAEQIVRTHWVQQGIWKKEWDNDGPAFSVSVNGRWKHEDPPQLELDAESGEEAAWAPLTWFERDERKRRIAERRGRKRQASRPLQQFVFQISKERDRIQASLAARQAPTAPPDVNTKAYENVRAIWIKRKIWNVNWGILPGMLWKHEHSPDDKEFNGHWYYQEEMLEEDDYEAREPSGRRNSRTPSPAISDNRIDPRIVGPPQQGQPAEMDLGNNAAERARSATNSPRPEGNEQINRPADPPLPTRPNNAVPGSQTVRRSKRIQDRIASAGSNNARAQPRSRRTAAGNPKSMKAAKPQGISKKPRGRPRKKNN